MWSSEVPVKRDIGFGKEERHFFFKSRTKGERESDNGDEFEMEYPHSKNRFIIFIRIRFDKSLQFVISKG